MQAFFLGGLRTTLRTFAPTAEKRATPVAATKKPALSRFLYSILPEKALYLRSDMLRSIKACSYLVENIQAY